MFSLRSYIDLVRKVAGETREDTPTTDARHFALGRRAAAAIILAACFRVSSSFPRGVHNSHQ